MIGSVHVPNTNLSNKGYQSELPMYNSSKLQLEDDDNMSAIQFGILYRKVCVKHGLVFSHRHHTLLSAFIKDTNNNADIDPGLPT